MTDPTPDPRPGRAGAVPAEPVSPSTALVHLPDGLAEGTAVDAAEQAGRAVLGLGLLVGEGMRSVARRVSPPPTAPLEAATQDVPPPSGVVARRVAVGMAFDAQRRALGVAEGVTRAVMPTLGWLVASPPLRPAVDRVAHSLDRAYNEGLEQEDAARELAERAGDATVRQAVPLVLDRVDLLPVVDEVLDELDLAPIVDKVIGEIDLKPVIDKVLDQLDLPQLVDKVIGEIDLKPVIDKVLSQIDLPAMVNEVMGEVELSNVVMDATGGITGDVVDGVRTAGATADTLVEHLADWLKFKRRNTLPPLAFPDAATEEELA